MKTLLVFLVAISLNLTSATKVYICDSPTAVAYHSSKNCRGLQKCTHRILEMTLKDAQTRQLRACKVCY